MIKQSRLSIARDICEGHDSSSCGMGQMSCTLCRFTVEYQYWKIIPTSYDLVNDDSTPKKVHKKMEANIDKMIDLYVKGGE